MRGLGVVYFRELFDHLTGVRVLVLENGEYNRRTMSRILAQPIYRDALLFGKFLAGPYTRALPGRTRERG